MIVLPSQPSPGRPPAKNMLRKAPSPSADLRAQPGFRAVRLDDLAGVLALELEVGVRLLRVGVDLQRSARPLARPPVLPPTNAKMQVTRIATAGSAVACRPGSSVLSFPKVRTPTTHLPRI